MENAGNGWPCRGCDAQTGKTVTYGALEVPLCSEACQAKVGDQYMMGESHAMFADQLRFHMLLLGSYVRSLADRSGLRNTGADEIKESAISLVNRMAKLIRKREKINEMDAMLSKPFQDAFATALDLIIDMSGLVAPYEEGVRGAERETQAATNALESQLLGLAPALENIEREQMGQLDMLRPKRRRWLYASVIPLETLKTLVRGVSRTIWETLYNLVALGNVEDGNAAFEAMQFAIKRLSDELADAINHVLPDLGALNARASMMGMQDEMRREMERYYDAPEAVGASWSSLKRRFKSPYKKGQKGDTPKMNTVMRNTARQRLLNLDKPYFYTTDPSAAGALTGDVIEASEVQAAPRRFANNSESGREAAFEYPANYAALNYVTQGLSKDALVVVMHALSYCSACKAMHPRIEKLADDMDDVIFVYNAVNLQVPAEGVTKTPDVRIYRDGEVVERFIGSKSTPELKRLMTKLADEYN